MKLTLQRRERLPREEEMVQLSCRSTLAAIHHNVHDTGYLIAEVCRRNGLMLSRGVGAVCAHVERHYGPERTKQKYSDLVTVEKIIRRFGLVFGKEGEGDMFSDMEELVNYGMHCLILTMKGDFRDSIPNTEDFQEELKKAVRPLLSSLFLEFIPPEYSDLLLKLYLQDHRSEEQRVWMQQNKRRYYYITPYHDFFQVLSSLSFHILNHRKVVDFQHYLSILLNPSSGSIEWPVVLCVRNLYKLPTFK